MNIYRYAFLCYIILLLCCWIGFVTIPFSVFTSKIINKIGPWALIFISQRIFIQYILSVSYFAKNWKFKGKQSNRGSKKNSRLPGVWGRELIELSDFSGGETLLYDTIMINTRLWTLSKPLRIYNTKCEPPLELWTSVDNDVSIFVLQL